jgi:ABC-type arginine transport system permease subunit
MKPLIAILFFIATGLYVCLSYLLMQLIDMNSKSGFVILDILGLFANVILINFLFRKYISQSFHKRPIKR